MTAPVFLGIGPRRTGSSWLYEVLHRTPGVWMPPVKELRYWDEIREAGGFAPEWRRHAWHRLRTDAAAVRARLVPRSDPVSVDLAFDRRFVLGRPSDRWYRRLFDAAGDAEAAGDITPSYFHLRPDVIRAVAELLPDVRVVATLRDPLDRLWSAVVKAVAASGRQVGDISQGELIVLGRARAKSYGRGLEQWSAVLPRDRIAVLWFDELLERPDRYLARVLDHIGVQSESARAVAAAVGPVNSSVGGRHPVPSGFAAHFAPRLLADLDRIEAILGPAEPVERWRARLVAVP
jgi:hypothetical protein